MLGAVVFLLVLTELAYRGQANVRARLRAAKPLGEVRHPYADSAWFAPYEREYAETFGMNWTPYVYFRRRPFSGSMINVDSAGHRRTVGATASGPDSLRVYFFGGSTMWGTSLRDPATIASVAARRLAQAKPNLVFDVTNFGESGYVMTQELVELQLQLRAGRVPDVVVFYDGMCDISSAAQIDQAGVPLNETNRMREFRFGRAVYGSESGVGSDFRAAGVITSAITQRFQFLQRLFAMVARPPQAAKSNEELAADVARVYTQNAEMIEALSRTYGFQVLYVWQPALHPDSKPLTPFEQQLIAQSKNHGYTQRIRALHKLITPMVDSAMRRRVGSRFVNEVALFANDTSSVYVDNAGHNTEKAIPTIVEGFFPALAPLVDSARTRPRKATQAALAAHVPTR